MYPSVYAFNIFEIAETSYMKTLCKFASTYFGKGIQKVINLANYRNIVSMYIETNKVAVTKNNNK